MSGFLGGFLVNVSMEANNMDPDHTASTGAV